MLTIVNFLRDIINRDLIDENTNLVDDTVKIVFCHKMNKHKLQKVWKSFSILTPTTAKAHNFLGDRKYQPYTGLYDALMIPTIKNK